MRERESGRRQEQQKKSTGPLRRTTQPEAIKFIFSPSFRLRGAEGMLAASVNTHSQGKWGHKIHFLPPSSVLKNTLLSSEGREKPGEQQTGICSSGGEEAVKVSACWKTLTCACVNAGWRKNSQTGFTSRKHTHLYTHSLIGTSPVRGAVGPLFTPKPSEASSAAKPQNREYVHANGVSKFPHFTSSCQQRSSWQTAKRSFWFAVVSGGQADHGSWSPGC